MTDKDPVAHIPPLKQRTLRKVAEEMIDEVDRQDDLARAGKFEGTHVLPGGTDLERLAVLAEEFGEAGGEVCKGLHADGYTRREDRLLKELIQVGACALAWAAAIREGRSG